MSYYQPELPLDFPDEAQVPAFTVQAGLAGASAASRPEPQEEGS